jgi:formylglycine-generating enzyme required for sulfatase activity
MSDDSRAIVPVSQHGVVASVGRRLEIIEKLLAESLGKKEYICPIMGAKFVLIPAGTFMMGSPEDEQPFDPENELDPFNPKYETLHQVTISKPFYLQTAPVTQRQWEVVMGNNPSHFKGEDRPVEKVSWDVVKQYIQKLNELVGDKGYRLPTEAEWEYAAKSGKKEIWAGTSDESSLVDYAWYRANSGNTTHPVGLKKPNDWGLYDMTGNVWEWCSDWYGEKYYSGSPRENPSGPSRGRWHVLRGGSWDDYAQYSRAATRFGELSVGRHLYGFRIAVSVGRRLEITEKIRAESPGKNEYICPIGRQQMDSKKKLTPEQLKKVVAILKMRLKAKGIHPKTSSQGNSKQIVQALLPGLKTHLSRKGIVPKKSKQ